ncbi:MAG TPA: hypothetical protein VLJ59_20135 [Mycobacteriales bacterium]|nr:hypothetical protein [Mycobacteriales bacterium]
MTADGVTEGTVAVVLTMGRPSPYARDFAAVGEVDLYRLADVDLDEVPGLLIGGGVDQVFLAGQRARLDGWVSAGGRVAVCGQVHRPFLTGLVPFEPLAYRGTDDLRVTRRADHPVWAGVELDDLTFRRGVAGFYGRGWYPAQPPGTLVVHGIGPDRLALDYVYPFGAGEVLVHGGNELWGYHDEPNTSARMAPQLLGWMSGRTASGPRPGTVPE